MGWKYSVSYHLHKVVSIAQTLPKYACQSSVVIAKAKDFMVRGKSEGNRRQLSLVQQKLVKKKKNSEYSSFVQTDASCVV